MESLLMVFNHLLDAIRFCAIDTVHFARQFDTRDVKSAA